MPELDNPGVLVVFTDFPPDQDDTIDEWYTREHLKSRVMVDGFQRGRRYSAYDGTPGYLAVYDTVSSQVLASQQYLDVGANPDEAEQRQVPLFQDTRRTVCDVTRSVGEGVGACIGLLAVRPSEDEKAQVREWFGETVLPQLVSERGVVAAHLWETNQAMLALGSRGFVPANAEIPEWLVVWEATRPSELAEAGVKSLDIAQLRRAGAELQEGYGLYQLLMALDGR